MWSTLNHLLVWLTWLLCGYGLCILEACFVVVASAKVGRIALEDGLFDPSFPYRQWLDSVSGRATASNRASLVARLIAAAISPGKHRLWSSLPLENWILWSGETVITQLDVDRYALALFTIHPGRIKYDGYTGFSSGLYQLLLACHVKQVFTAEVVIAGTHPHHDKATMTALRALV